MPAEPWTEGVVSKLRSALEELEQQASRHPSSVGLQNAMLHVQNALAELAPLAGAGGEAASGEAARRRELDTVSVDPRPMLGAGHTVWKFSLHEYENLFSFLTAVWRMLRRTGAEIPALTYGTRWVLADARTGQEIRLISTERGRAASLKEAGILAGALLQIVPAGAARPG